MASWDELRADALHTGRFHSRWHPYYWKMVWKRQRVYYDHFHRRSGFPVRESIRRAWRLAR